MPPKARRDDKGPSSFPARIPDPGNPPSRANLTNTHEKHPGRFKKNRLSLHRANRPYKRPPSTTNYRPRFLISTDTFPSLLKSDLFRGHEERRHFWRFGRRNPFLNQVIFERGWLKRLKWWACTRSQSLLKSGHFRASRPLRMPMYGPSAARRNPFLNQVIFEPTPGPSIGSLKRWVAIPS